MTVKLGKKPAVEPAPPLFRAALRACVGCNPGFLPAERLATAGPFAWLPPDDWSALDELLKSAADGGVAAGASLT